MKQSEVEGLIKAITGMEGRPSEDRPIDFDGLRAYIRAAERMRKRLIDAKADGGLAYDRAKTRLMGEVKR